MVVVVEMTVMLINMMINKFKYNTDSPITISLFSCLSVLLLLS